MVEIAGSDLRLRVIAHGQPGLGSVSLVQIVGWVSAPPIRVATQPGSRALENTPGQRRAIPKASKTSCNLLSAAGRAAVPAALDPGDIVHIGACPAVQTRTQIDQPRRPFDHHRQNM